MRIFKNIASKVRWFRMTAAVKSIPKDKQREAGREIYDIAHKGMLGKTGDEKAACAVAFCCQYPGHVTFHIKQELDKRINDPQDPTYSYKIENVDGKCGYILVVVASSTDADKAIASADASAMSAVLKAPTASGNFTRYMLALDNYDAKDCELYMSEVIRALKTKDTGTVPGSTVLIAN